LPIIEFLEEVYPGTFSVLPKCPVQRQKARALAEVINSGIQPLQNLGILAEMEKHGVTRNVWASHVIDKGLTAFEEMLKDTAGRFCVGDEVTIADVCLVPQIYNAKRFGVDVTKYKKINQIYERCLELDAFHKASPEMVSL
jgi:maleylpyruvate isomerase